MSWASVSVRQSIRAIRAELDRLESDADSVCLPCADDNPQVFSREEIGLRPADEVTPAPLGSGTMFHISGGKPPSEKHPAFQILRTMQSYHMDFRGWDDAGYNWAVCNAGHVYTLRGALVMGAHARGYNRTHMSVVWLGGHKDYADVKPSPEAFSAMEWLLGEAVGSEALGHRQVSSKKCPGDEIFAWLQSQPGFSGSA